MRAVRGRTQTRATGAVTGAAPIASSATARAGLRSVRSVVMTGRSVADEGPELSAGLVIAIGARVTVVAVQAASAPTGRGGLARTPVTNAVAATSRAATGHGARVTAKVA